VVGLRQNALGSDAMHRTVPNRREALEDRRVGEGRWRNDLSAAPVGDVLDDEDHIRVEG